MDAKQLAAVQTRLECFVEEISTSMGRKERRHWAGCYLRGLLLDGERKSVEPLAARVLEDARPHGARVQALQQFVNQSPWPVEALLEGLARRFETRLPGQQPRYWIIDETSFPKAGTRSVGVMRQYCGALGKLSNCQVAVSLHGSDQALERSQPLSWRLFLPDEWMEDPARRTKAGVPPTLGAQSKPALALALIDQARQDWGLQAGIVLADEAYGGGFAWRAALRGRVPGYCVRVPAKTDVWTQQPPAFVVPAAKRPGVRPPKRAYLPADAPRPQRLSALAKSLPAGAWREVSWRHGSRGRAQRSRFACLPAVWAARGWHLWPQPERVAETLLVEWPEGEPAPTKYWLAWGAGRAEARLEDLVATAKARWRIEQDYRELKDELGLDHFEGRSWLGWHHHVALVTAAFVFLREEQRRRRGGKTADGAQKKSAHDAQPAAHPPSLAGRTRAGQRLLPVVPHSF